jgi:hypothetical protein
MWQKTTKGIITKQFFPSVMDRLKIKHLDFNFKLTQFLTGQQILKITYIDLNLLTLMFVTVIVLQKLYCM